MIVRRNRYFLPAHPPSLFFSSAYFPTSSPSSFATLLSSPRRPFQAPSIERVSRASSMDQSEIIVIAVTSLVFILFVVAVVLVYVYHQDGNCALLCATPTNTSVTTQQSQVCQVRGGGRTAGNGEREDPDDREEPTTTPLGMA